MAVAGSLRDPHFHVLLEPGVAALWSRPTAGGSNVDDRTRGADSSFCPDRVRPEEPKLGRLSALALGWPEARTRDSFGALKNARLRGLKLEGLGAVEPDRLGELRLDRLRAVRLERLGVPEPDRLGGLKLDRLRALKLEGLGALKLD